MKPFTSNSMQLKVVESKVAPVPGPLDQLGCLLLSALLFLGGSGSFWHLFSLPGKGVAAAFFGILAIIVFYFILPLPQVTARHKLLGMGALGGGSVLLWILTGERSRNGLALVVNQVQQLFAAEYARIEPRYIVTVEPEQFSLCITLFLLPFALLIALLCSASVRYSLWQPGAAALLLVALLGLFDVTPPAGGWTLLFAVAVALHACRALSAEKGAPDLGSILLPVSAVLLAAFSLGGLVLLLFGSAGEPLDRFFEGQAADIRHAIHQSRYDGDTLPGLPEGDLTEPGQRLGMKTAIEMTFDSPYPMHLRGYIGQSFEKAGWKPLPKQALSEFSSLFYRLHQNEFYPQTQLASLAKALGHYDPKEKNEVVVKNLAACTSAVYAPYGLASVKTDGLLEADRTTEVALSSPGWSGITEYTYSVLPKELQNPDTLVKLFDQQKESPNQALSAYLAEEARYRHFVYENYTALPDAERNILKADLGEAGVPGQTHRGYADAKSTIFSVLNSKLGFSAKSSGFSGEGSLIESLYKKENANAAQYASAAVLMLRYCGIPARYVEGYLVTAVDLEGLTSGETVYVPAGNASAWAEYYHDGVGWLPFDVIPGYQQAVESGIPPQGGGGGGEEEPPPPEETPPVDPEIPQKNPLVTVLMWLLPLWLLLLSVFAWLMRRYWIISRRDRSFEVEDTNQAVCDMAAYLLQLFAAVGLPNAAGSIRRLTVPAEEKWGREWGNAVSRITDLFEKAAFSPHWLTEAEREEAQTLMDQILDHVDQTETKKSRFFLRWIKCLY